MTLMCGRPDDDNADRDADCCNDDDDDDGCMVGASRAACAAVYAAALADADEEMTIGTPPLSELIDDVDMDEDNATGP